PSLASTAQLTIVQLAPTCKSAHFVPAASCDTLFFHPMLGADQRRHTTPPATRAKTMMKKQQSGRHIQRLPYIF
uniref:hypothetical protein n=1 Tax=Marinobacterium profundum TaxID=1714300 RepID=UPI001C1F68BB